MLCTFAQFFVKKVDGFLWYLRNVSELRVYRRVHLRIVFSKLFNILL